MVFSAKIYAFDVRRKSAASPCVEWGDVMKHGLPVLLGLASVGFGGVALWLDLDPWHILWYLLAWAGYFAMLHAVAGWSGHPPLLEARKHLPMFLWSIPFWFFFELYNVRLQNWYYVYAFHHVAASFLFSCIAFSTVMPACLLHARIVETSNWFANVRWKRVRVEGLRQGLLVLGILCLTTPLVFPRHAYWMTWGALACLPEAMAYRLGSPSVLRDLEGGQANRLLSLIVGGTWAGLLWESMNAVARCKWIYTVPGLEEIKLFEMPLLGFLGFPALALNAYPTYGLIERAWGARSLRRLWRLCLTGLWVAIVVVGFGGMMQHSVRSRRPLLEQIAGLDPKSIESLTNAGVPTPEILHTRCRRDGAGALAELIDRPVDSMTLACQHAGLSIHKGMGTDRANLLMSHGLVSITDLAKLRNPDLVAAVVSDGRSLRPPVTAAEVGVWYRASGKGSPIR